MCVRTYVRIILCMIVLKLARNNCKSVNVHVIRFTCSNMHHGAMELHVESIIIESDV